jgi:hypothetical protein
MPFNKESKKMNTITINGVTLQTILGVLVAWAKAILLHAIAVIVIIAVIALVLDYLRLKTKSN